MNRADKTKIYGLYIASIVLIVISFVMYYQGWLSIGTATQRRMVEMTMNAAVAEIDPLMGDYLGSEELSQLNEVQEEIGYQVDAKTYLVDTTDFLRVFGKMSYGPHQLTSMVRYLSKYFDVYINMALGDSYDQTDITYRTYKSMLEEASGKIKTASVVFRLLSVFTLIAFFVGLICFLVDGKGAPWYFTLFALVWLIFFVVIIIQAKDFMKTATTYTELMGDLLPGTSNLLNEVIRISISHSAVICIIAGIASIVCWTLAHRFAADAYMAFPKPVLAVRNYIKGGRRPAVGGFARSGSAGGTKFCMICGSQIPGNSRFCPYCGRENRN